MKHKLVNCIVLLISINCLGQENNKPTEISYPYNSIYIEFGGNAVFFGSLNYERIIVNKNILYLSGRIGIGYGNFSGTSVISMPVLINGIFQIYNPLAFEVGLGVSFMNVGKQDNFGDGHWIYRNEVAPTGIAGIRLQLKNGFLMRLDFTPFYANLEYENEESIFHSSFGLSIGYSFGK